MSSLFLKNDLDLLARVLKDSFTKNCSIMITGATGLIGSLIVKSIIRYNQLYDGTINCIALARNQDKVKQVFSEEMDEAGLINGVEILYQDISEPISEDICCDYIIHTANATASKYFITNPVEVMDSIYSGTKQVLEYAKRHKIKGMVYLSSMEVFGVVDSDHRARESELGKLDLQNVRSCYSEGKRHAELLCKCYAEEYGVPVKVARLVQTFGAGVPKTETRVFAQFARSAIKGEDIVLHTKGQSVGNYCYTRDVIKAIFLLLRSGENGEAYTVVNEETTRTIAEMAEMVASKFSNGKSKVVFDIPEGNHYGYAPETRLRLSAAKLRALGWQPKVGLEEMYQRMVPDLMEQMQ